MDQPPIIFVAGLPRSGSTLLMNILGQNPRHHVTPTNGLLDMLVAIRDQWTKQTEFRTQGLEVVQPRIGTMLRGMVEGYYTKEFKEGKVVFDKCRGWLAYIEMMQEVLQRQVTVLVTVRDIRAIMASVEKLGLANPLSVPRPNDYMGAQAVEGRTAQHLSPQGVVGIAVSRLRDALRRPHKARIVLIPYNQLCRNTHGVMNQLHSQLGLPAYKYDPEHVEQITYEDDSPYGVSLHNIRPKVELGDATPWKGVLPDPLCDALVREYADIQRYAEAT